MSIVSRSNGLRYYMWDVIDVPYIGSVTTRFTQLRLLGRGSFGVVYLVADTMDNNREYALKMHALERVSDGVHYALDQTRLTKTLNDVVREDLLVRHINGECEHITLPCYRELFCGTDETGAKNLCILMEYVRGDTVDKVMEINKADGNRFTQYATMLMAKSLLTTLKYIHSKGVYHRDIKPENIIQSNEERYALLDFGLSCGIPEVQCVGSVGTPLFQSPEMLPAKFQNVNKRTYLREYRLAHTKLYNPVEAAKNDVYQLGCTLAEVFYNNPLFFDPTRRKGEVVPDPYYHVYAQKMDTYEIRFNALVEQRIAYARSKNLVEDIPSAPVLRPGAMALDDLFKPSGGLSAVPTPLPSMYSMVPSALPSALPLASALPSDLPSALPSSSSSSSSSVPSTPTSEPRSEAPLRSPMDNIIFSMIQPDITKRVSLNVALLLVDNYLKNYHQNGGLGLLYY